MRANSRFGGPVKTLVGPGLIQSTTTVGTQPTTTIPFSLSAVFTETAYGSSFFGRFGNLLQDVGHPSEQSVHVRIVCAPFCPALVATS